MLDVGTVSFPRLPYPLRNPVGELADLLLHEHQRPFDQADAVAILDLCCFYDPAQLYPALRPRHVVRPDMHTRRPMQREVQLVAGTPPSPDVLQVFLAQGVVAQQVRLALRKGKQGPTATCLPERFSEPFPLARRMQDIESDMA